MLELFTDMEEYIGEAIYSLAKQGSDQSMAETIRQFIETQVRKPCFFCESGQGRTQQVPDAF